MGCIKRHGSWGNNFINYVGGFDGKYPHTILEKQVHILYEAYLKVKICKGNDH